MYHTLKANNRYPVDVEEVDLSKVFSLHPFNVHPDNYGLIRLSILEKGLKDPIVILPMFVKEWRDMKEVSPELLSPPDFTDNTLVPVVMCGNNRVQIAKDLRYTHIDAIICSSKEEVNKWCGMMRRQWRLEEKKLREQMRESGGSPER